MLKDRTYIVILSLAAMLVLAVIGADYGIRTMVEQSRQSSLRAEAERQQETVAANIAVTEARLENLRAELATVRQREYPVLHDLERVASNEGTRIRRVERVGTADEPSGRQSHSVTFSGSVGSLVRLVKRLEESYILDFEQMTLQPIDQTGESIALTVNLKLAIE